MKKLILSILMLAGVLNAQTTISFTPTDASGSSLSFTKTVGGATFTFSAVGYLECYSTDGLYAYTGTASAVQLTVDIQNGYSFTLNSLKALANTGSMTFSYTYVNNTTGNFTRTGLNTSTLTSVSGTGFPISNVKQVVISSSDYATVQDFVIANITTPVELTSFTASATNSSTVLSWKTATEVTNYGFEVERRVVESVSRGVVEWSKIGFVAGNGTSNTEHHYSYTDANVSSGTYAYRLKQIDHDGTYKYSDEAEATINIPNILTLANYPNPFNPTTTFSFTLAQDGFTTLKIYNMLGKEVATLVSENMKAGVTNTATFNASKLSSGVYFSRIVNNGSTQTKKLVLMK